MRPAPIREQMDKAASYFTSLFVLCAFLGWCLELVFRSSCSGSLVLPGFLYGPYCPIYGVGAVLLVSLCDYEDNLRTYTAIAVYSSALEYFVSLLFETVFDELLWDYSTLPLSIGTRVNFLFSLAWGVLGLLFLRGAVPTLKRFAAQHRLLVRTVGGTGIVIMLLDTIASIVVRIIGY